MYGLLLGNTGSSGGGSNSTQYQMRSLGDQIPGLTDAIKSILDVRPMFPHWINEKNDRGETFIIEFVQSYYDWLYAESKYELGSSDTRSSSFRRLIDIDETPVHFLKHFAKTFAPGFPDWFITEGEGETDDSIGLRKFINNIRQAFYHKKSNEEAFRYFFQTLYDGRKAADGETDIEVDIDLYYPKIHILRLNGGRFDGFDFTSGSENTGEYDPNTYQHLGGSYINGPFKLQDSNWFQDFSYVISTGVDLINEETGEPIYSDLVKSLLHPTGLKAFLEMTKDDYVPPDGYSGGFSTCEKPIIGNYFPYRMNHDSGLSGCIGCTTGSGDNYVYHGPSAMQLLQTVDQLGGNTGWTAGDQWSQHGPVGNVLSGPTGGVGSSSIGLPYNMPTFGYPSWADGICGDAEQNEFGNLYIGSLMYLCPIENSPNQGITGCESLSFGNTC